MMCIAGTGAMQATLRVVGIQVWGNAMSGSPRRITFTRALRVAGYNRPLYVVAAVGAIVGVVLLCLPGVPWPIRWLGGVGAVVAGWLACSSFFAFHWMF